MKHLANLRHAANSSRRRREARRLRVEPLEHRQLLAVFQLLAGVDDGQEGSLRWAIDQANTNGEDDEIVLAQGTYQIGTGGANENSNVSGDLDLSEVGHTTTIRGAGAGKTILDASGLGDRVVDVMPGAGAALEDLTIRGGTADEAGGGGVRNAGSLTIRRAEVVDNVALGAGGGVLNVGYVEFNVPAAIEHQGQPWSALLLIVDSSIVNNQASHGGGIASLGDLPWSAGPIRDFVPLEVPEDLTTARVGIQSSTIANNHSEHDGGGIYAAGSPQGIVQTTISGNRAGGSGGGYRVGTQMAMSYLYNSTVYNNQAELFGGGIETEGEVILRGSIVAGNHATLAGNDLAGSYDFVSSVGTDYPFPFGTGAHSDGHNLFGELPEEFQFAPHATDIVNVDPRLGRLQDNGGPTLTHAPLPNSPAIDAGYSRGFAFDQRGVDRTVDHVEIEHATSGDGTDIGAVELETLIESSDVVRTIAERMAADQADTLRPPNELANRYESDLRAIFAQYPEMQAIAEHSRVGLTDSIVVRLTVEASQDLLAGNYRGLDALNELYGVKDIDVRTGSVDQKVSLTLTFNSVFHLALLADVYAVAEGVDSARVNELWALSNFFGFADGVYTFTQGWGDCPSGCTAKYSWRFTVEETGQVHFIDDNGPYQFPAPGSPGAPPQPDPPNDSPVGDPDETPQPDDTRRALDRYPEDWIEAIGLTLWTQRTLVPNVEIAERVRHDLRLIREQFPEVDDIGTGPAGEPDKMFVQLTEEASQRFLAGEFTDLDQYHEDFNVVQIEHRLLSDGRVELTLYFGELLSLSILDDVYRQNDAVADARPHSVPVLAAAGIYDSIRIVDGDYVLVRGSGFSNPRPEMYYRFHVARETVTLVEQRPVIGGAIQDPIVPPPENPACVPVMPGELILDDEGDSSADPPRSIDSQFRIFGPLTVEVYLARRSDPPSHDDAAAYAPPAVPDVFPGPGDSSTQEDPPVATSSPQSRARAIRASVEAYLGHSIDDALVTLLAASRS